MIIYEVAIIISILSIRELKLSEVNLSRHTNNSSPLRLPIAWHRIPEVVILLSNYTLSPRKKITLEFLFFIR
jgi:hypothetical protein